MVRAIRRASEGLGATAAIPIAELLLKNWEEDMPKNLADPHVLQPRTEQTAVIATEGVNSPEATKKIEAALRQLDGVIEVAADVSNARVTVKFDPRKTDVPGLHECIEKSGHEAADLSDEDRLDIDEKL